MSFWIIIQNKKRRIQEAENTKIINEINIKNQELERKLLNDKLEFSQEHLIYFANQLNKIESFIKVLQKTTNNIDQISQEEISDIKLKFSGLINNQLYLKKLQSLTTKINQDFYWKIRKMYPNITKDDEQLLSFLVLEMTSKEISGILNITTNSVHTKRYRLRKKLQLKSQESFIDFYNRINSEIKSPLATL